MYVCNLNLNSELNPLQCRTPQTKWSTSSLIPNTDELSSLLLTCYCSLGIYQVCTGFAFCTCPLEKIYGLSVVLNGCRRPWIHPISDILITWNQFPIVILLTYNLCYSNNTGICKSVMHDATSRLLSPVLQLQQDDGMFQSKWGCNRHRFSRPGKKLCNICRKKSASDFLANASSW